MQKTPRKKAGERRRSGGRTSKSTVDAIEELRLKREERRRSAEEFKRAREEEQRRNEAAGRPGESDPGPAAVDAAVRKHVALLWRYAGGGDPAGASQLLAKARSKVKVPWQLLAERGIRGTLDPAMQTAFGALAQAVDAIGSAAAGAAG